MTILATTTISGHEARGQAQICRAADGATTIEVDQLWVAPGAPDVRMYVSPDPNGVVDRRAIDLGPIPERQPTLSRPLPADVDPAALRSIIVFCKVYSVLFGYGTLTFQS